MGTIYPFSFPQISVISDSDSADPECSDAHGTIRKGMHMGLSGEENPGRKDGDFETALLRCGTRSELIREGGKSEESFRRQILLGRLLFEASARIRENATGYRLRLDSSNSTCDRKTDESHCIQVRMQIDKAKYYALLWNRHPPCISAV